jgi:hypothetical protein
MEFFHEFHANAFLPKVMTASFLTLIPKKDHPQGLFDYRPICLIGSIYKILSKALANRLKKVLGNLISSCQSAFLPQRQILDGVVVLNEIIDLAKRRKDACMLFKVDFERAYDTVSWRFLEGMMSKMGFSKGWLRWMRACIFDSTMSVLINGSPTVDFKVARGLRQGDPLSPFLFLIVVEGLAGLMRRAVDIGKFKGYQVNSNIRFQMLQFADDTILMGEGTQANLWTIKTLLRSFELVSGLKINFVKSKLYGVNIDPIFLAAGATFLSCRSEVIPFKFLGIPVGANPRRKETWKPVVDAMSKRLCSWNSRHLSYGGRITLINSVLSSLPLYFFSFFKAPRCVLQQLVRLQRNFLWGGGADDKRLCWVKWDQVCLPKEQGGLGVKNLELFNMALLSKWKWRFLSDDEAMWADLLRFRYGHLPTHLLGTANYSLGAQSSLWWRDVTGMGSGVWEDWFKTNVGCCVGDGKNVGFWKFKWFGNHSIKDLYPNLFVKEAFQDVMISDRLIDDRDTTRWAWHWRSPLSGAEEQQLNSLIELLVGVSLQANTPDRWRWTPETAGNFTVSSCYTFLVAAAPQILLDENTVKALQELWLNDLPTKVSIFAWRLLQNKLATRDELSNRGIILDPVHKTCVLCFCLAETCDHLFFLCPFTHKIWTMVGEWLGVANFMQNVGCAHFTNFGALLKPGRLKKVRHLIWCATTWCIWSLRNNIIFRGSSFSIDGLMDNIKTFSWLWFISRRGRNLNYVFSDWCTNPLACLENV